MSVQVLICTEFKKLSSFGNIEFSSGHLEFKNITIFFHFEILLIHLILICLEDLGNLSSEFCYLYLIS